LVIKDLNSGISSSKKLAKSLFKQKKLKILNGQKSELKVEVELLVSGQTSIYDSES
jgi:hypothetical protein